jgi:hypothetical protein
MPGYPVVLSKLELLQRRYEALVAAHGKLCGVCRLTCEIPHKAVAIEFTEGRLTWFHNAHEKDCWEELKQYILASSASQEAVRMALARQAASL